MLLWAIAIAQRVAVWLLLLLGAGLAEAQTSGTAQLTQPYLDATKSTDMSTQAFTALLGTFFTNPFAALGSASTLLGSMFLVFNTFILVAGTIWATYGIGVAIVQTAHEGQLMGKKLSQVWLPIRMVTGVASLIPAFGGFSLSQAVLVFATTLGIGVANLGFDAMVNGTNNMTTLVAPSFVSPKAQGAASVEEAAFTLFRARVCMNAQNNYARQQREALGVDMTAETITATSPTGITGVQYGKPDAPAYCGGLKITANAVQGGRESSSIGGYRVASVNYRAIAEGAQSRATGNFAQYVNGVAQLADDWFLSYKVYQTTGGQRPSVPVLKLAGLATTYYQALQPTEGDVTAGAQALSSSVIESMKKYGWFGAGAWYATLAEVNAAVAQAAQSVSFESIPIQAPEGSMNSELRELMQSLEIATARAPTDAANANSTASASSWQALCLMIAKTLSPSGSSPTGNCSLGQSFAMTLIDMSTAGAGGATSTAGGALRMIDPIIAMKNMGDYLMLTAESLFTVASYVGEAANEIENPTTLAGGAGWVADKATGGSMSKLLAPLKALAPLLPMLIGGLFIVGAVMSLWLPMVPFVNWWGGLVQYLTIFFEGIAAGPIWAFVHLDANGDGMGQRTETGYLFIINMLFRPILMLLGFVAAAALMMVMGSFLFWLYPSVMSNVQGNSITGIFSVIGFLLIFWMLMHTLVTSLSNLSVLLPDQALAWAGKAIGAQLGRDTEHGTRGQFMAFGRLGKDSFTVASAAPKPKAGGKSGAASGSRSSGG
jgi:conjugal transfer/type IV secretion protein DotA/TraY